MRRIIHGKLYDTDSAIYIARDAHYNCGLDDWEEVLYKKESGEYFLYGWGGPGTIYADINFGETDEGEHLIPLSTEEARRWMEEHATIDEYEHEYGPVSEDDTGELIETLIPIRLHKKLLRMAYERDVSVAELIDWLVCGDENVV